jgi:regulatory protein
MDVERFDGARGAQRDGATNEKSSREKSPRGDGLAPVTYLFAERASRTPSDPTTPHAETTEEDEAAAEPVTAKAVTPKAVTPKAVTPKVAAPTAARDLPTLSSVFGELEAQIEAQLAERREAGAEERAKAKAERVSMNALTRRGMSKREVERSLRARELDDDTVASELDRLEGVGLIDDMALAQNLVGTLQERKGLGRSAIAAELTRRLLAPAAIEYALDLIETGDELGRAREIAVKRASQLRSYDRDTAVRRLSAFLARRGYSGSTIRSAVDHALPATPGSSVRFR